MRTLCLTSLVAALVVPAPWAAAQETIDTRIGKLSFTHDFANGYPTKETIKTLFDAIDFQRVKRPGFSGAGLVHVR